MIIPDVWADMVQAEFTGNLVVANFAYTDDRLVGAPGDTIKFPKWNALTDMTTVAETASLVPEVLTTDEGDTATIQEVGKAIEFTDRSLLVSYGDPMGEARRQLGILMARKIDKDLTAELENALNKYDATAVTNPTSYTGALSWNAVVDGGISVFQDAWDPAEIAGLVIHSKQHLALLKDENFLTVDKIGNSATLLRGQVGSLGQVPVVVSDRVTVDSTGADPVYHAYLIKRNVLGLLYKRRPIVETDRDILARSNILTTNVHYGVKLTGDTAGMPGVAIIETLGAPAS
jgi:N4-gp56 family major capsid protein